MNPELEPEQLVEELQKSIVELDHEKVEYEKYANHIEAQIADLDRTNEQLLLCLKARQENYEELKHQSEILKQTVTQKQKDYILLTKKLKILKNLKAKQDPNRPGEVLSESISKTEEQIRKLTDYFEQLKQIQIQQKEDIEKIRKKQLKKEKLLQEQIELKQKADTLLSALDIDEEMITKETSNSLFKYLNKMSIIDKLTDDLYKLQHEDNATYETGKDQIQDKGVIEIKEVFPDLTASSEPIEEEEDEIILVEEEEEEEEIVEEVKEEEESIVDDQVDDEISAGVSVEEEEEKKSSSSSSSSYEYYYSSSSTSTVIEEEEEEVFEEEIPPVLEISDIFYQASKNNPRRIQMPFSEEDRNSPYSKAQLLSLNDSICSSDSAFENEEESKGLVKSESQKENELIFNNEDGEKAESKADEKMENEGINLDDVSTDKKENEEVKADDGIIDKKENEEEHADGDSTIKDVKENEETKEEIEINNENVENKDSIKNDETTEKRENEEQVDLDKTEASITLMESDSQPEKDNADNANTSKETKKAHISFCNTMPELEDLDLSGAEKRLKKTLSHTNNDFSDITIEIKPHEPEDQDTNSYRRVQNKFNKDIKDYQDRTARIEKEIVKLQIAIDACPKKCVNIQTDITFEYDQIIKELEEKKNAVELEEEYKIQRVDLASTLEYKKAQLNSLKMSNVRKGATLRRYTEMVAPLKELSASFHEHEGAANDKNKINELNEALKNARKKNLSIECKIEDLKNINDHLQKQILGKTKEPKPDVLALCEKLRVHRVIEREHMRRVAFANIEIQHVERNIQQINQLYSQRTIDVLNQEHALLKNSIGNLKAKFQSVRSIKSAQRLKQMTNADDMEALKQEINETQQSLEYDSKKRHVIAAKIDKQIKTLKDYNIPVPQIPTFFHNLTGSKSVLSVEYEAQHKTYE